MAASTCQSILKVVGSAAGQSNVFSFDECSFAYTSDTPQSTLDQRTGSSGLREIHGLVRLDNRAEVLDLLRHTYAPQDVPSDLSLFGEAWSAWGEAALARISGSFAVAIWDKNERRLTLVRDHTGDKALYYLHQVDLLAFCTQPLPLRAINQVDTSLDEEQMMRYVALLPATNHQTFFKNINLLPPGHLLTYRDGLLNLMRYWNPIEAPATRFRRDEDYVEAFLEVFDRAVGACLRTDGKVGAQLSGGMDSGSVTAGAARLLGARTLTAFTSVPQAAFADVNPAGRFGNEGPAAAQLAAMYPNIDHVLVDSSGEKLIAGMQRFESQGLPVFNPLNQMWMDAILDDCRTRGITVLLTGASGNATLSASGLMGLSELFKKGQWVRLARLIYQLRHRSYTGLRRAASMALAPAVPVWLQRQLSPDTKQFNFDFCPLRSDVLTRNLLRQQIVEEMHGHFSSVDAYRSKTFEDFDPGPDNAGVSAVWGIEMRDPTRDRRVFEFCFSIPIEQYLVGGQTRSLVRRAMRGRMPDETLQCRDRGLQAADWYLTMGGRLEELAEELALIRLSPMANRLLDLDRLQHLIEHWPSSGFELERVSSSWHLALSRGIAAGNFIRQFE